MEIKKVYRTSAGLFESLEQATAHQNRTGSNDPLDPRTEAGGFAAKNHDPFSPNFGKQEPPVAEFVLFADGLYFQLEQITVQK